MYGTYFCSFFVLSYTITEYFAELLVLGILQVTYGSVKMYSSSIKCQYLGVWIWYKVLKINLEKRSYILFNLRIVDIIDYKPY